ncbi:MAG: transglutaminase-like domain-containing protein [Bacteroidetes bacterium]|nr:transglutaminase-like domain-containing protein [Bacteroidota bacterium]
MPDAVNNTLNALINLLDEPDEKAFALIREQIELQGMDAVAPLEKCLENNFSNIVQERIQSILRKLIQDYHYAEFVNWLSVGSSDLLKGFLLVTKIQDPSLDEEEIIISIEQLKMDIWVELHENLTALENVKVLNHLLFDIHHFGVNNVDNTLPENNYINTLLESKKGSSLSLGILFIILARKLGLPVYGVDLPQHFILAYLTAEGIDQPGESDVLFYINPYSKGAVFTRRDIDIFIGQMKIKPEKSFFAPCSNPDIIRRLINSLILSHNKQGNSDKAEDLETLLTAFE